MQKLKTFTTSDGEVLRTSLLETLPLFSLKDLIKILGIDLPMKEVKSQLHNGTIKSVLTTEDKNETFVTEQALYKLYAMSTKDDIALIVDWMTTKVIPIIKIYDGLCIDELLEDPLRIIVVLNSLEKIKMENALLKNKLEIQDMHESVYVNMYGNRESVPLSSLAKYLRIDGINQNRLLDLLRTKQVLQPNDMPYQTFIDKNYFQVVAHTKSQNGEQEIRYTVIVFKTGINFIRKLLIKMAGEKNE